MLLVGMKVEPLKQGPFSGQGRPRISVLLHSCGLRLGPLNSVAPHMGRKRLADDLSLDVADN